MNEYRIIWDADAQNWRVVHTERGWLGIVTPGVQGRFEARVHGVTIASVWTLRAATEQVVWYDRARNEEAE